MPEMLVAGKAMAARRRPAQHRPATSKRWAKTVIHVVLLDNGRVRQLPWLAATAYEITAFAGITAFGGIPAFPLNP